MKLFTPAEQRYKINTHYLIIMREGLQLSVAQFAEIVGWSTSYQYKLESGKISIVSEKTKNEIETALARCGI